MHRTLKAATARPPAADLPRQQARFDAFRHKYNHERPHEGIGQRMPHEIYRSSLRPNRADPPEFDYPGHFERRRAQSKGAIKWKGQRLYVSETVRGEILGLEEIEDGLWSIYLGPLLLGRYDERERDLELL